MNHAVSTTSDRRVRHALSSAERLAAHLVALAGPMVGVPFRGEPTVVGAAKVPSPIEWERCRYATAILRQRDPGFAGDLAHLQASLDLFGTDVFRTRMRCRIDAAHPDGMKLVVVATVQLAIDMTGSPMLDLRSGDRAAAPALQPPSPPAASTAGQTEGTAP